MPLTPDALAAALKRPLPPLAVVAGEEALLVMEAADAVRAAAKAQGFDEREVFEVDKSGGWGDVLGAANSLSLFVQRRVIEVRVQGALGVEGARALTDWLDSSAYRAFPAMMLDMYPRGSVTERIYAAGENPLDIASWFDPANYMIRKNREYGNLWIQGGPRARAFFADDPQNAPALNKIPLVRWQRRFAYASSTHMLLPRSLNLVYDQDGGEMASGALLHAKFLSTFIAKSAEELDRRQHYADSQEYRAYHQGLQDAADFWCPQSRRYRDWRQLEEVGLISRGNWA